MLAKLDAASPTWIHPYVRKVPLAVLQTSAKLWFERAAKNISEYTSFHLTSDIGYLVQLSYHIDPGAVSTGSHIYYLKESQVN